MASQDATYHLSAIWARMVGQEIENGVIQELFLLEPECEGDDLVMERYLRSSALRDLKEFAAAETLCRTTEEEIELLTHNQFERALIHFQTGRILHGKQWNSLANEL